MCNLLWTPSLMSHCTAQSILLIISQEDTIVCMEFLKVISETVLPLFEKVAVTCSIWETGASCMQGTLLQSNFFYENIAHIWAVVGWKSASGHTGHNSGIKKTTVMRCIQKRLFNHLKRFLLCPHNIISRNHLFCFVNET